MPQYKLPYEEVSGIWKNVAPGHLRLLNSTKAEPRSNCKLQQPLKNFFVNLLNWVSSFVLVVVLNYLINELEYH